METPLYAANASLTAPHNHPPPPPPPPPTPHPTPARLGGQVGRPQQRLQLGRQEHAHRPPAAARQRLHVRHLRRQFVWFVESLSACGVCAASGRAMPANGRRTGAWHLAHPPSMQRSPTGLEPPHKHCPLGGPSRKRGRRPAAPRGPPLGAGAGVCVCVAEALGGCRAGRRIQTHLPQHTHTHTCRHNSLHTHTHVKTISRATLMDTK